MKTEQTQQPGIIDALTAGLNAAFRRPWLIAMLTAVDLVLWLSPRLAVDRLVQRFLAVWEAFFRLGAGASQPNAAEMVAAVRAGMTQIGQGINLVEALTGSWLSLPSAAATVQITRLTLVSDAILSPFGLSIQLRPLAAPPWRPPAIEISSVWVALVIVIGLWLAGQLIAAYLLRAAAQEPVPGTVPDPRSDEAQPMDRPGRSWAGLRGLLALMTRFAGFTVLLMMTVAGLYVPMGVAMLFMATAANAVTGLLFAVIGGLTLWVLMWLLTSVFFVSEALVLEGQSLPASLWRSFVLVRRNALRVLGLVVLINLILFGFRAVWGLLGQTPLGAIAAMLGNAYLATAMLLAVFTYYGMLRRKQEAAQRNQKGRPGAGAGSGNPS